MARPAARWCRSTASRPILRTCRRAAPSPRAAAPPPTRAASAARPWSRSATSTSRPASMTSEPNGAAANARTIAAAGRDELLRVEDLKVHFPLTKGIVIRRQIGTVQAVDGVSFALQRGDTLGLVGESGCGKSTTGLAILRMLEPTAGRIVFEGQDITALDRERMRPIRRRMQMVYQDPYGSLNPRMKVRDIIGEPLEVHGEA